jgi:hypothetical protein
MCTANYIANLFFSFNSYLNYDRFIYNTAALLLAAKLHDEKRQASDFSKKFHNVYHCKVMAKGSHRPAPPYESHHEKDYLNRIFKAELQLMKNLGFDLEVDLPINYLERILKRLYPRTDDKLQIYSISRALANEVMRSIAPLCVRTEALAVACVVLSGQVCNMPRPHELLLDDPEHWWRVINPDLTLEEINQALRLLLEALQPER